ncbi:molybdopterin-dependent oxidoreductase [Amycolatopsis jiangsuensis]|uniref:Anaerobic selenocysteine-containing dehydrogenase/ferredoxin-NADP reductase n=1 Tax=Amycolatopsis jiangsuensis TaxID=1181879 RepID=A0A840IM88_9PSEU|nr:molybdopterin-dependent oxidoreductase [Amycolatopsis jiangsuensis]MBB4683446.1 anaerobic selenocysteine-containing dehydrogenase/ferredoxin-NADP reductase [Amycolatopsis jiangsuensis]
MSEVRGYCTLCRSRCGAVYTVEDGRLRGVRPDPGHPTGAAMCPKGRAAPELVHSPARLTRPLRRTTPKSDPDPGWREITWDEALTEIAARLGEIRARDGAEAVAFSVTSPSGTPMSDAIDWVERFIRHFGSPNTLYSTEICNWHKDFAHAFTFGRGLPGPDYASTGLAVLWGHNPAKSWLAQSAALATGRGRGARLAVIDPRRSTSALQADHWLRVRPGTDGALALGLAGRLLARRGHDERFVRSWTNAPLLVRQDTGRFLRAHEIESGASGFVVWDERSAQPEPYDTSRAARRPERFALHGLRRVHTRSGPVDCVPAFAHYEKACAAWPLDRTASFTTVEPAAIEALAEDLAAAESVSYASWTGIGQHGNATQTERAVATLYALTGSFDAPGGNVVLPKQPIATVSSPDQLDPRQRGKALGLKRFPLGPPAQGWITARDFCRAAVDGDPYPVRALVSFGGNLLLSQPDPHRTAEALRSLEFAVHLDLFENPTARFADLLLPVQSPWEHEAFRPGFEITLAAQERVQLRPRMVAPVGESRSDTEVVFDLATRLGLGEEFFGGSIERGWNHQLAPLGLTADDLRRHPGGVDLPLEHRHRKYSEVREDGSVTGFDTPTGRVELYSERLAEHGQPAVPAADPPPADPRRPLVLTCAKNGYFCHSQHRGISSLRKRFPEPVVELSAELARDRGIEDGQWARITTAQGAVRMRARIDPALHPDVVVAEYGWWQPAPDLALPGADPLDHGGTNYNLLIGTDAHDPVSGSSPLRCTPCDIRPAETRPWTGRREFVVDQARLETADVLSLRLRPVDGRALPAFRPGQHLTVAWPDEPEVTRSYSLTGAAAGPGEAYSIAVRRVAGGRFSPAAHDRLRPGTRLLAWPPSGLFAIPAVHPQPIVLLAAGIGITPFLSHLETLARAPLDAPEVVLHYGSRHPRSQAFRERIAELIGHLPHARVADHYSRPEAGTPSRVSADSIDEGLIRRRARFYLCGPESMLTEVTAGLVERGVPRFDIFTEKFHAAPAPVRIRDDATANVRFARSGRALTWRKTDGTLLQLADEAGITLPSGCRLGQCESCSVALLRGTVAHLVTPADDLPEDHCLTCQSVPTSDVVLDA